LDTNPACQTTLASPLVRRRSLLQLGGALLAGCGGGGSITIDLTPTPVCVSTLVPAYFSTDAAWSELAASTQAMVVIANVSNGPGSALDAKYLTWINAVRGAGHRVKGYVYTSYAKRSSAAVLLDMERWRQFYALDDFFVDEVTATSVSLPYYSALLGSASGVHPADRFMLNPGAVPVSGYFSLLPGIEILVFESAWSSYSSASLPTMLDAVASQCWIMALAATQADMQQAAAVARNRRFAGFFATDLPFTTGLPSYWAAQKALAVCG
jgi:hypothetical protein